MVTAAADDQKSASGHNGILGDTLNIETVEVRVLCNHAHVDKMELAYIVGYCFVLENLNVGT